MNGNYQSSMAASGKKGWMWPVIVLVVIVVLLAAYYVFYYGYTPAPSEEAEGGADDVATLEQELGAITTEGLGSEFGDIEKELAQ